MSFLLNLWSGSLLSFSKLLAPITKRRNLRCMKNIYDQKTLENPPERGRSYNITLVVVNSSWIHKMKTFLWWVPACWHASIVEIPNRGKGGATRQWETIVQHGRNPQSSGFLKPYTLNSACYSRGKRDSKNLLRFKWYKARFWWFWAISLHQTMIVTLIGNLGWKKRNIMRIHRWILG